MNSTARSDPWRPVSSEERHRALDGLRGVALLGVLLVNLLAAFRVSLFAHILTFHTHTGWANRSVDILTAWLLEFKALTLFSFLFGVGVGIQAERATSHAVDASRFLIRRFAVLLAIGLGHMVLIWNGDILTLYAIAGLLLIPFVATPARRLVALSVAAVALNFTPVFPILFPTEAAMRAHAVVATRVYAEGSFTEILALRWGETWQFIAPLLVNVLPKTFGLMLLGLAAWRAGVLKRPAQHRSFFWAVLVGAGVLGAAATTLLVWSDATGLPPPVWPGWLQPASHIPLALAFGAGLLLWLSGTPAGLVTRGFAAAGQMALSNYLAQSVIFSVLFYGFGFGLFGRLGSAVAALIGVAVFGGQLAMSYLWLQRYRFGPAEWLWRSLTYGHWQPIRRTEGPTCVASPSPTQW